MAIGRKWWMAVILLIFGIGIAYRLVYMLQPEYAYVPPQSKMLNKADNGMAALAGDDAFRVYDLWGQTVIQPGANALDAAGQVTPSLTPAQGAVAIDESLLRFGRDRFYKETFSNEIFLTDIMGIVNGPLSIPNMMKAIVQLGGKGTTNLQVELASDVTIGGKTYKKGDKIDTGIDVAQGSYAPLGMPVKFAEGRLKVGISCAACHATVDRETKRVVEGAPNADLNAGLIMALATNSTAYFTHVEDKKLSDADTAKLAHYVSNLKVTATDGRSVPLPDARKLEEAVDADLAKWPPGNFDSTIDLKNNPAQIPDSFTRGGHPFGWSGFAMAGPFHGLSAFNNNVHAQNADSLAQSEASAALFGIDKERYLGIILQNAAHPKYRYDPNGGKKPSEFFARVDPTPGVPGVNELVKPPTFPKLSLVAPDGVFASSPGYKFGEQVNAMSAWQNSLAPPDLPVRLDPGAVALGKAVFRRAGCISCHAGEAYTNHRIIPATLIGTEPSRAQSLKKTENLFADAASMYAPDTPVPIPGKPNILRVPTAHLDPEQIWLAFARGNSPGGYKVKGLVGLYWTAPYLHDGGVAAGTNLQSELGVAGTLSRGIAPDPANSLRALVDKSLRQKVIEANKSLRELRDSRVLGIGHEYWVDPGSGFTPEQQEGLIQYLLSLNPQSVP